MRIGDDQGHQSTCLSEGKGRPGCGQYEDDTLYGVPGERE